MPRPRRERLEPLGDEGARDALRKVDTSRGDSYLPPAPDPAYQMAAKKAGKGVDCNFSCSYA